jgi:isopentenyl-diphosphate delta-isomerase
MESDTVLVTDMDDNILLDVDPSMSSKMITHRFTMSNPRGILHRAFSVFLFDVSTSQLLLQKRASTKITFPNVWTNTCCSHPLLGMDPPESELEFTNDASSLSTDGGGEGEITNNRVKGAMNAAIRKLRHELGIPTDELSNENGARFKYLTRVHYWAADTITHGMDSPWGEHEIDYILFVTVPNRGCLTLNGLNDDEVDDVRWVDRDTMRKMFDDETLLFSPWFRIIANRWLMGDGGEGTKADGWWHDLDRTMNTNDLCDHVTIHRFDPPPEHMGGAGDAGPMFID